MADPEIEEIPQEEEAPKKGKMRMWIIIGAALILLGSVGFLTRNYLVGSKGSDEASKSAKAPEKVLSTMNLDSFLVNLADEDATRFVKVTFRLGLSEAKLGEELAGDPVVLAATRDTILTTLCTKKSDDLITPEGKEKLKKEIREKVSKVLPKGQVVEVYLIDFVVQL
jgi:flagellar protein FliL